MKGKPAFKNYENKYESFIKDMKKYMLENSSDVNAKVDLLRFYAKSRQFSSFEELAEDLQYSNNYYAQREIGRYYVFAKREITTARVYLNKAIELNPSEPMWVYYFAGRTFNYYEKLCDKLLYTAIPKNASTSLKNFILDKVYDTPDKNPHAQFGNPFFKSQQFSRNELDDSKKVLVIREPIARIKSYYNKNIVEEDSLNFELGLSAKQNNVFYGLPTRPDFDYLVDNIWDYCLVFNDVLHHILPQAAYVKKISDYDAIFDVSSLDEMISEVSSFLGLNYNGPAPRKMVPKIKSNSTFSEQDEFLKTIYLDDYSLLKEFYNGTDDVNTKEKDFPSFLPLKDEINNEDLRSCVELIIQNSQKSPEIMDGLIDILSSKEKILMLSEKVLSTKKKYLSKNHDTSALALRDIAISLEKVDTEISYKFMEKAYQLRPAGKIIIKKLIDYNDIYGNGVGIVNKRAYLFNKYIKFRKKILMQEIANKNADLNFSEQYSFKRKDEDKVTIITCMAIHPYDRGRINSHFLSIMGHALSIAKDSSFSVINVLFTREWTYLEKNKLKNKSNIINTLYKALNEIDVEKRLSDKIKFEVVDDATFLPSLLQGCVIKFKSVAEHHSTYIYDKDIYDNFPVVTTAFNSHFTKSIYNDFLIVRDIESASESKAVYYPPSLHSFKNNDNIQKSSKNIITAYTADRIKRLMTLIEDEEWRKLVDLFDEGYVWHLAGYKYTEELIDLVPPFVANKYAENIVFHEYLDLDLFFKNAGALLCSPHFNGGGGTARLAISYDVPVLCCKNGSLDVATTLPNENLFRSFYEALVEIENWMNRPNKRIDFIDRQHKFFEVKTDISRHDSNLPNIIKKAIKSYYNRSRK